MGPPLQTFFYIYMLCYTLCVKWCGICLEVMKFLAVGGKEDYVYITVFM